MIWKLTFRTLPLVAALTAVLSVHPAAGVAGNHNLRAGARRAAQAPGGTFPCTGAAVPLPLPSSVNVVQVDAMGAAGGTPDGAASGAGGGGAEVKATIDAALARKLLGPASSLLLYTGCAGGTQGGFGYGQGGPPGSGSGGRDGNGGGGGTAVLWQSAQSVPLVVAGGGGGGGGEGFSVVGGSGGGGGSAGVPEGTGGAADGGGGSDGNSEGGPGGYNPQPFGFGGTSADTGSGNGGAGGGGGGWRGGGGGQTGGSGSFNIGGGGGGAGTSYADDSQCEQAGGGTPSCVVQGVVYHGLTSDTNNGQGELTVTYTMDSRTSVTSSRSPSVRGGTVHFIATIAPSVGGGGAPTGTVQFSVDGVNLGGPVALNGGVAVSATTSALSVGQHNVMASYSGSAAYGASSGSFSQTVEPLMSAASPAPQGQVGQPYHFTPQLGNGTAPYSWSVLRGTLPPGLSLNPSTGSITGTPQQASSSTVTLLVTDSSQPAKRGFPAYTFEVGSGPAPPAPSRGTAAGPVQLVVPFGEMTGPDGVAVDQAGDVFVADGNDRADSRVLEVPDGASTPITLPFSGLNSPAGLAVDGAGDLFVADQSNNRVLELAHGASKASVLPFGAINQPTALAADQTGDVFVGQETNSQVLELPAGSQTPTVVATLGSPPVGLAVDQKGDLFASLDETPNVPANNKVVELAAGTSTPTILPFTGLNQPTGVAVDQAGDVFVSDNGNWRVLELPHGTSKQVVVPFPTGPNGLGLPYGVAVTAAGDVYAADNNNEQVDEVPARLTVTSPAPNASVGVPYSFTPQLTGGFIPFTWSVVSGQLPAGLSLNPSTGTISGTPTATGSSTVTIEVADSGQPQLHDYPSYSITVQAGLPAASIQPSALDFGTQTIFRSYPAKAVTLSNAGHAPMSISAVAIAGADAGDFAFATDGCAGQTLAPGASCQVQVKFVPWEIVDVGAKTATLTFTDNAPGSPQTAPLTGTSQYLPRAGNGPALVLSPGRVSFRHTTNKHRWMKRMLMIRNAGRKALKVRAVRLTGPARRHFRVIAHDCTDRPVRPGKSCVISVRYRPGSPGSHDAFITIRDNAPGSPHVASVTATAA